MADRCFVAVDIDDPSLEVAFVRAQGVLLATGADVKAVEEENIHITLTANTPITLVGDRLRLRQLFLNLIDNAIKYTPEGGSVSLSVEREDGSAMFRVSDTGMGIPLEKQRIIFEAFTQTDSSTTRKFGGTGLGLAISSRLVSRAGGKMWVESEPGRGSTFSFTMEVFTRGNADDADKTDSRE